MTESALGWALLSRAALRRAEEHLRDDEQGVRDEIGFLALHRAYADRFFPGTSVLQTRIKYILFVPWIYARVAAKPARGQTAGMIQQEELVLARRLKTTYGTAAGVIGARSYPKPTSQPPSLVYWTALSTWGILRPMADGSFPSRALIHHSLDRSRLTSRLQDDDGKPLEDARSFFVTLPKPPTNWDKLGEPLTFDLDLDQARFIQQQLVGIRRPGKLSGMCLLARLAERGLSVADVEWPWLQDVLAVAERDDIEALLRAQQAAALTAIGRAVYAALVEDVCETEDRRLMSRQHRDHLQQLVQEHRSKALKLDVTAVQQDAPYPMPASILDVVTETQRWLRSGRDYTQLRPVYEEIELRRKGQRARLSRTLASRERRAEWNTETSPHPLAEPLEYRWRNMQRLLGDL